MAGTWDEMQNENLATGLEEEPADVIPRSAEEAQQMGFSPEQFQELQTIAHKNMNQQFPVSSLQQAGDEERQYSQKHQQLIAQQEAGINRLDRQLKESAAQPYEWDNRPLLALADMFASGENYSRFAHAPTESKAQREQKMLALQDGLQQRREALSKSQLDGLKEKILAKKALMPKPEMDPLKRRKMEAEIAYLNSQPGVKADKRDEEDVQELQKRIGDAPVVLRDTLANLDSLIPGGLDGYTEDKDIPGVSPGAAMFPEAAVSWYAGPSAGAIQQDARTLVGTMIKLQSGTAASEKEVDRKMVEMGMGAGSSEAAFVRGLKTARTKIRNELKNKEAAFRPEVVSRFNKRGGISSSDLPNRAVPTVDPRYQRYLDLKKKQGK